MQGLHPRMLTEGFDLARAKTLEVLDKMKIKIEPKRDILLDVARTSLRTKVHQTLADVLTEVRSQKMFPMFLKENPVFNFFFENAALFIFLMSVQYKHLELPLAIAQCLSGKI